MIEAFYLAVGLFTRVRVPAVHPTARTAARSILFFPVVGLALGGVMVLIGSVLWGSLPHVVAAGLAVGAVAILSGGLHLDGLADTFDALGVAPGGEDGARRARMLDVMRDPRMGPVGGAALGLALYLKITALGNVADPIVWLLPPVVGRWLCGPLMMAFPYARTEGAGSLWRDVPAAVEVLGGASVVVAVVMIIGPQALGAAVIGIIAAFALARVMHRRLGGLTGDVYGAAVEVAEVAVAIVLAMQ